MRIKNSIKNMTFGIASQILSVMMAFFTRTVFIYVLGAKYLGIEGLFTNILSILSLTNLGMESAIIFSLYKPLKEKNEVEIKGYMKIYEKVYRIVGVVILFIGIAIIPFLPTIINDTINIKESITVVYIMFLLNTSISYIYIYKQSILIANQQNYLISKIHAYFIIISNLVQICTLIFFKSYIPVLGMQLICRILENIIISKIADKKFPFLKDNSIEANLSIGKKKQLFKDVYSMLLYKISGVVINSTDNIIISYFVGIIYVGIYSNYLLVISTVRTLISYIFSSIKASVGNLIASSEDKKKEFMFNEILFVSFWVYGFCSISFYILFDDFIKIWIGDKFLLDSFTLLIIVINFYTGGMQEASTIYRDATGLFGTGKYRPVIAAILNLIISIILAPSLGIAGILLGTIASRLAVYFWFDPYVVYKYIFFKNYKIYFLNYIKYTLIVLFSGYITGLISGLTNELPLYISFIIKIIICIFIPNFIFVLIYMNSKYFKYIKDIIILISKKRTSLLKIN